MSPTIPMRSLPPSLACDGGTGVGAACKPTAELVGAACPTLDPDAAVGAIVGAAGVAAAPHAASSAADALENASCRAARRLSTLTPAAFPPALARRRAR